MTPSVGRIVHYVSYGTPGEYGKECRAAIVTEVASCANCDEAGEPYAREVSLCVLNPTGQFFNRGVAFGKGDAPGSLTPGTWHWPERIES